MRSLNMISMLLLVVTIHVAASDIQSLPQYYPDSFHAMGMLQKLDTKNATIVINASKYLYDVNIKVHSLTTEHSSLAALQANTEIGYAFYMQGNRKVVNEIWVLPKGAAVLR